MPYTVSALARRFGLSRSALLYYDSIGLLKPRNRAAGEYRSYGEEEAETLARICLYRKAGLSLADIRSALDGPDSSLCDRLTRRLDELNREMDDIREQQRLIVGLLARRGEMRRAEERVGFMNRELWTELLLSQAGFDRAEQLRWHMRFERHSPEKHAQFLKFLCIPDEEAAIIRALTEESIAKCCAAAAQRKAKTRETPEKT